jgi:hypothetical protein
MAGVQRAHHNLRLSNEQAIKFGIARHPKARALQFLASAGLLTVKQQGRGAPVVSLVLKRGHRERS